MKFQKKTTHATQRSMNAREPAISKESNEKEREKKNGILRVFMGLVGVEPPTSSCIWRRLSAERVGFGGP
jgi:hypothetical protein